MGLPRNSDVALFFLARVVMMRGIDQQGNGQQNNGQDEVEKHKVVGDGVHFSLYVIVSSWLPKTQW